MEETITTTENETLLAKTSEEEGESEDLSEEASSQEDALEEEEGTAPAQNTSEVDQTDWRARCEQAEKNLDDTLDFAMLYAPYAEKPDALRENGVYKRFCELRGLGLSVKEAFSAANCHAAPIVSKAAIPATKKHLTSSVPKGYGGAVRLSGEELMIARELLGDAYSGEELTKLYRRVVKS